MKKKCTVLSLVLSMLLALLAGCGKDEPVDSLTPEPPQISDAGGDIFVEPEPIFERARVYGFVPDDLWQNPDELITMADFCRLLSGVITLYDEGKLERWNELAAHAMSSEETVHIDSALIAIFEAAMAMDIHLNGGIAWYDNWQDYSPAEDWNEGMLPDYTGWPNWEELYTNEHGTELDIRLGAFLYGQHQRSSIDNSYLFDPEEDWTFRFGVNITRQEAIRAATVFAESDPIILHHEAEYVMLENVGTYDPTIITEALLTQNTDLPLPTQDQLPASWHGAGLSRRKDAVNPYVKFRESDIRILADNGFNFTRVFFDFATLQYPYQNTSDDEVNLVQLRELDQLIAWGMEYGVHIQISCGGFLEYESAGIQDFERLSGEEWDLFGDYWGMLAKRYADIPPEYLSFDLINEWSPNDDDTSAINTYADIFGGIAQTVWAADSDRVVLVSFHGYPSIRWVEAIASQGIALGIHPYRPVQIINRIKEVEYPAETGWPIPWFGSIMEPGDKLTITGDIGGGTLKIYFESAMKEALLNVYADGELYETIEPVSDTVNEYGNYREFTDAYEVSIPEGTETLTLQSTQEYGWIWYQGLRLEKDGRSVGVEVHDWLYLTDSANVNLYVDESGWHNTDNLIFDAGSVYEIEVEPILNLSEKYHVGVMVNEMGLFGDADMGEAAYAYMDDIVAMFESHGLGWCYCEMETGYLFSAVSGQVFVLKDSPVGYVTYEYEDGRVEPYWICEKMLDVLQKYITE